MEDDIRFKPGQEIKVIYWPDDTSVVSGENEVEKITVVMENGQMALVPWFAVWVDGKVAFKHNASLVSTVTL